MDQHQVSNALKALSDRQIRFLTGTVYGPGKDPTELTWDTKNVPVRLDSDSAVDSSGAIVSIPSLIGPVMPNSRVVIATVPPMGMVIIGIIDQQLSTQILSRDLYDVVVPYIDNVITPSISLPFPVLATHVYTSDSTWTKPSDFRFLGVEVQLQAGGGGSGATSATSSQTTSSGGGQGGAFVAFYVPAVNLPSSVSVTVGAGGAAGAAPGGNGGTGGTSSFGSFASVLGGQGGAGGGSASGGQTTQSGGDAAQALTISGDALLLKFRRGDEGGTGFRIGSGATGIIWPGYGGASEWGQQRRIQTLSSGQIPPATGNLYGGGASGRAANGSIAAADGAAGGQGIVVVHDIYRT